jgi:hypothetical protein
MTNKQGETDNRVAKNMGGMLTGMDREEWQSCLTDNSP